MFLAVILISISLRLFELSVYSKLIFEQSDTGFTDILAILSIQLALTLFDKTVLLFTDEVLLIES